MSCRTSTANRRRYSTTHASIFSDNPFSNDRECARRLTVFVTWCALQTMLNQLKAEPNRYKWLRSFVTGKDLRQPKDFVLSLMREDRELGMQLLSSQESIAEELQYNVLPDLLTSGLEERKTELLRQHMTNSLSALDLEMMFTDSDV
eukprot:CAMPEP_0184658356 /NCGR_PEP_ID=MMETSP0308-20130426/25157_1 /TAXON_ID=38269 /ORGANISM="Gloeochaete witrockiana, Strain SAG 46.84" /LENGTH=146 /DNA_ID=CAMNT_0027097299 /DNA_START=149 /DNA_END=589 /DNA_ORIENTATION=+